MTGLINHLQRLRDRVESVAGNERSSPLFSIESMLLVLSVMYGAVMAIRASLYEKGLLASKSLPCRVVSIGNIVAGGTGKTPMTIFVAQTIRQMGYRVVVLSRGYRGRMEDSGGVVSDGRTLLKNARQAGDEPYLMAACLKDVPVVVGKRRYEAGMLAIRRFQPDVIVLDDAFQHMRLKRDLNLVLLDHRSPVGNGHLLPRGRLREPLSALSRAHALVFTRSKAAVQPRPFGSLDDHRPVFYTIHVPVIEKTGQEHDLFLKDGTDISVLRGKKVVAFAGLADNGQFFDSLESIGCRVGHRFAFADHHAYGFDDFNRIAESAERRGADFLVTTLKDYVKIEHGMRWPVPLIAVNVTVRLLGDRGAFIRLMSRSLEKKG